MEAFGSAPAGRRGRPVVLCLLDGIGEREDARGNAVALAEAKVMRALGERFGKTILDASGEAVGLREGEAGTGALGYEAIGTGRAPRPAKARIDRTIEEKKLGANAIVQRAMWIANDRKCRLHLFMPIGEASGHASMVHLSALLRVAEAHDVRVVVHAFLEQRAGAPRSAIQRLEALAFQLEGIGKIGTISGEAFALDRGERRWEGAKKVFSAIVRGEAPQKETLLEALGAAYEAGRTDATIEPVRIGDYEGMKGEFMADFSSGKASWEWFGEECGFFMTHRPDRIHALAAMMARREVPPHVLEFLTERGRAIHAFDEYGMLTWTEIDPAFEGVLAAFPSEPVRGTLREALAGAGLFEIRVTSEDRAMHLTRFFDANPSEQPTPERVVIVPDEAIGETAARIVEEGKHDVVVVSLPFADRASHRGDLDATKAAVALVDEALGRIARATEGSGGALFVAGTHGAAEEMLDGDGKPRGAHTKNPVPLWLAFEGSRLEPSGSLSDVAPTLLDLLGLDKPEGMTGRSLLLARRA